MEGRRREGGGGEGKKKERSEGNGEDGGGGRGGVQRKRKHSSRTSCAARGGKGLTDSLNRTHGTSVIGVPAEIRDAAVTGLRWSRDGWKQDQVAGGDVNAGRKGSPRSPPHQLLVSG